MPVGAAIHPVLHVSLLKKKLRTNAVIATTMPAVDDQGRVKIQPVAILDRKLMKKDNRAVVMELIQWSNMFEEDAT